MAEQGSEKNGREYFYLDTEYYAANDWADCQHIRLSPAVEDLLTDIRGFRHLVERRARMFRILCVVSLRV